MSDVAIFEKTKTMTTKELADALGVSERTVRDTAKNLGMEINFQPIKTNGGTQNVKVYTEAQATAIKVKLQNHSKVSKNGFNTLEITNDIEMLMIQKQLDAYKDRRIAELTEELNKKDTIIETQKPMVEFYDAVTGSNDTIDMGRVAKILNIKGIGRNNLFEILRDKNVLQNNNIPYQKYVDCGYFRVIESKYSKPNGDVCINCKTVVYQTGLDFIRKLLTA